jgi:hypothetical protein
MKYWESRERGVRKFQSVTTKYHEKGVWETCEMLQVAQKEHGKVAKYHESCERGVRKLQQCRKMLRKSAECCTRSAKGPWEGHEIVVKNERVARGLQKDCEKVA